MIIDYLENNKSYINEVVKLLYNEFIDKNKISYIEMERIIKSRCNINKIPLTIIAIIENELAGFVSILENDLENNIELKPWLAGLFVKEHFRKQGIGKKLIEKVIKINYELGNKNIYLKTENSYEYYKKLNWSLIKKVKINNLDSYVMEYK